MSELDLGRRGFLLATAALAACKPSSATTVATTTAAETATAAGIDTATIAAAERIAGVAFTAAERDAIAMVLGAHVERAKQRRAHALDDDIAPATRFDPRLPGRRYGPPRTDIRVTYDDTPLPKSDVDIAFAPIRRLGGWLRRGKITSVRLTELALDRLQTIGKPLACVARTTDTLAHAQAETADRLLAQGRDLGPLHGIPWGAKDILDTSGIATTWGAEPFRDRTPDRDATVVARLHAAGAVLCAKLTTGALAYGDIWDGGVTKSPWSPHEGASGSSAGPAAATAAGLVAFAIGSETLGSIVSPSMRCGTTGLRPTFGRVPRTGAMPLCWSLDKLGPIARTVEDAMWALAAIGGPDDRDPTATRESLAYDASDDLRGLRIGVLAPVGDSEGARLDRAAIEILRRHGATLVDIALPQLPYESLLTILIAEAAAAFEPLTLADRDDELRWQGPDAWPNTFRTARFIGAIDLINADRLRRQLMIAMQAIFDDVHAIVGPSFDGPMLLATNMTGHPCLVVRTGFVQRAPEPGTDGTPPADAAVFRAPHGITAWGRLFDEGTLARIGLALERDLDVAAARPPTG
jgi:Asp-tRNA(Asn)/Glu-tRNA(Gln) amidotransferase A subunit family amidase